MKHFYALLITILFFSQASAQNGFTHELRGVSPFSIAGSSHASLLQTIDSSYMAIYNVVDTGGGTNLLVVKINNAGNILWQRQIDLPGYTETLLDAVQMSDSSINILCTYEQALGTTIYDEEVYIVKIDLDGNFINWNFITNSGICCWDIPDGRLNLDNTSRMLISHLSFGITFSDGIVRVIDTNYVYVYGAVDGTALYHATMFQDSNNDYFSFGYEPISSLQKRAVFLKRNPTFNFQWQKFFRHGATSPAKMNIADDAMRVDSNFVLLMHFEDTNALNNIYIVKTDNNGDSIVSARFIDETIPFGIYSLGSNGYIIGASSFNGSFSNYMELIQLDTSFVITARQKYRYKNFNEGMWSFKLSNDGCYLLAGSSDSGSVRNTHVLKVKPDLCVDPVPSFTVNYNTGYSTTQAGILINNNSDYGILDSANTLVNIDFGDGTVLNFSGDTISHVYVNQGTYIITLTVTTPCGTKSFAKPVIVPCTGQPTTFTYTENLLSINVSYNYAATSYQWDFGDTGNANTQNAAHTYALPGTYYVCLNTNNTCGNISLCDSIDVECTPPVIPVPTVVNACTGTQVNIDAGNSGSLYLWSDGQTTQQAIFTQGGTYTVTVTNVCGEFSIANVDVQFNAKPFVDIGADSIVCINDPALFGNYASTNNYDYQWNINNQFQGTGSTFNFIQSSLGLYHVTLIANNNGCLDSASRDITVSPQLFCDTVTYCIPSYSSGTSQGDYIKRVGIGTINNITGGTGQPSYVDYTNISTTLTAGQNVTITLEFVEVNPMYYRIWVDYNQDGVFSTTEILNQNAVNSGVSTVFTALSTNAYGGPTRMRVRCVSATNGNIDPCGNYTYGQTEDYTINILNGNGAPIADFDADTTHIYINDIVNFTDQSYNNPTAWEWTFTGASTPSSTLENPTGITYPVAGCYPVFLKAINANGFSIKSDTCFIDVDLSLSTSQINTNGNFAVQPNPFKNNFKLSYKISEDAIAEIRDATGRIINIVELLKGNSSQTIDFSQFADGIYFLMIKSNQEVFFNHRLLKIK